MLVTSIREVITKGRGERMCFAEVEDLTGHAEVTFFPRDYSQCRELLHSEQPLCLMAKLESAAQGSDSENDESDEGPGQIKLLGHSIRLLEEVCAESDLPILIAIPASRLNEKSLLELRHILQSHQGGTPVTAEVRGDGYKCLLQLGKDMCVKPGPDLTRRLDAWKNVA